MSEWKAAYDAAFSFWLPLLGCTVMAANNAKIEADRQATSMPAGSIC